MPPDDAEAPQPELTRVTKTIAVVDMVESVRLVQANEAEVIDRWRRFVHVARSKVLPHFKGRMVKSLGDGMLIEFDQPPAALAACFSLLDEMALLNQGCASNLCIHLRFGLHEAEVLVDELDIYGAGVNLAARISGIAGVDQVLASTELCSSLIHGVDAEFEDLGACFFKHLEASVPCTRLHRPRVQAQRVVQVVLERPPQAESLLLRLAVLPLRVLADTGSARIIGELVADNLCARLARSAMLRVISRLSTMALASRPFDVPEIARQLRVNYLVSGHAMPLGAVWRLNLELIDAVSGEIVWQGQDDTGLGALIERDDEFSAAMASQISLAICSEQLRRISTQPWPSLQAYSLQSSGVSLMHRASVNDFQRARQVLESLVERHPSAAQPRSALANWWVLHTTRGFSQRPDEEAAMALMHTRKALELAPEDSSALAMQGFVQCHMVGDLVAADESLCQALEVNPSEALAWLYRSVVLVLQSRDAEAWQAAETALSLSPIDPQRYYFDALASAAAVANGQFLRGVELAERALRVNRNHLPTVRALTVARVGLGQIELAKQMADRVLELAPDFTVRRYLAAGPRGAEKARERYAAALLKAGLPMN